MYSISVIIPCYNACAHLDACLASLRVQRLSDAQFIFVDDGSTDGTGDALEVFARIEPRATVIHQSNGGVSAARNAGIDLADGQYLSFLDADDVYEEDALRKLYRLATQTNADIVSADHTVLFEPEGKRSPIVLSKLPMSGLDVADRIIGMHNIFNNVWNKLYRRTLFDRPSMRLDEEIRIGEDAVLNLRLYLSAQSVAHLSERTYVYRVHAHSAMARMGEYATAHQPMLRSMAKALSEMGVKERFFRTFLFSSMWIDEKEKGVYEASMDFDSLVRPLVMMGVSPKKLPSESKKLYYIIKFGLFPIYYIMRHSKRKIQRRRGNS